MDSNAIALFKFGDLTAVSLFSRFSSFESIVEFICSRWDNLKRNTMSLSYALANNPRCLLLNEDDFICLSMVIRRTGLDSIDINVEEVSVTSMICGISESLKPVCGDVVEYDDVEFSDVELSGSSSKNHAPVNFFRHRDKVLKSTGWATAIEKIGQIFEGGCPEFRNSLCKFATEVGFEFEYLKNDKNRVTAQCRYKVDKGCPWRIHGSIEKVNGFFYIRTYVPNHTCIDIVNNGYGQGDRLRSGVLASVLIDDVKGNPSIRPKDVLNDFRKDYGYEVSYKSVWRGIEKAKQAVYGDASSSYDSMRHYFNKVKELDPNFQSMIDYDHDTSRFERCFVAFGACLDGFKFCRPMLFLDGTFLYGKYKGTLLAATAKDGNNGLFHVAFAIVGSENIENWRWFLQNLEPHINERTMTFISDRHQGIITSVKEIMPSASHSFCMFHIRNNLRDKLRGFSSELRSNMLHKISQCSLAPTHDLFQFYLSEMKKEGGTKVEEFMNALPAVNYASAYFPGKRYGEMCSNAAESFNSEIKEYKGLPVLELVDQIRLKVMQRMTKRRQESLNWKTNLCPLKDKRYKRRLAYGKSWDISSSNDHMFEVHSDPSMSVDIQKFTCTCGKWQHQGFPCVHAIAVLSRTSQGGLPFIEPYFYTSHYQKCYGFSIPPIPSFGKAVVDEEAVILPPATKRAPGRPKKTRYQGRGEVVKRKMTCSRCGKSGYHNRRSCKEPLQLEQ